VSRNIERLHLL